MVRQVWVSNHEQLVNVLIQSSETTIVYSEVPEPHGLNKRECCEFSILKGSVHSRALTSFFPRKQFLRGLNNDDM